MGSLLPFVYLILVLVLCLHGIHRAILVFTVLRCRNSRPPEATLPAELPRVTVQLPLYNERDVAARLMQAVFELQWPPERLQVQLLDDSTDDTLLGCETLLRAAREKGISVEILRRTKREGFKAGALRAGLSTAQGELIAIFDADFLPSPGFLRRMIPSFSDPAVGMVQARWGHINEAHSVLTQAQALMLDGHFVVEHAARHDAGLWFHFNGTAGIWRRRCIEDAGGWSADTLTEDLDLSYRAQLAGWHFVYRVEEVVPAELPDSLSAFFTQQSRWARGSMQTLRKLSSRIFLGRHPLRNRLEALFHLSANLAWPFGLGISLLLPAMVSLPVEHSLVRVLIDLPAFLLSTGANVVFYTVARGGRVDLWGILKVLLLGVGLSVNQTRAVAEGLFGPTGSFIRTPKRGESHRSYLPELVQLPLLELGLSLWNLWGLGVACMMGRWGAVPFLALFSTGFGSVVWWAWREQRATLEQQLRQAPVLGR